MKRSEINAAIKEMEKMLEEYRIILPPFCYYTPEEWKRKGDDHEEIRQAGLGWDITDYGMGRFSEIGFSLITLRNGCFKNPAYPKPYAEKLLYIREGQSAPMHFHFSKMEDIINRGGGNVVIAVYPSTQEGALGDSPVTVHKDGVERTVEAGTGIILHPGESITIPQGLYHDFTLESGTGPVLLGEVSMCNDDENDNRFLEPIGRFPEIEEDEPPYRLLCNEYDKYHTYHFYGWENAKAPAITDVYTGIKTPIDLYNALEKIWCADTCAPRMRDRWTPENRTLGQCSITAFLAQDIFGGDVYGILRPDGNYHCYNVIGDCVFDLTSEQFGDEVLIYQNQPMQSRAVHFAKEEKRLRYEKLKADLAQYCREGEGK